MGKLAKKISIRTIMTLAFVAVLFTVMAVSQEAAVMDVGWDGFKDSMETFFYKGMGSGGFKGLGIAIAVIGIGLAIISFVVHKLNPQSRMPGWFMCLLVALLGSMLFTGVEPVLDIVQWIRDTIMEWFGFKDDFKDWGA